MLLSIVHGIMFLQAMNAVLELCTPIQVERELPYITKKRERFLPPKRLLVYSVPFPADLNAVIAV